VQNVIFNHFFKAFRYEHEENSDGYADDIGRINSKGTA
jgi:hypothetical protein